MPSMFKTWAIEALGGSIAAAAREIGITPQAVGQWPDELPPAIRDRVQAALWRRSQPACAANGTPGVAGGQHAQPAREAA